MYNNSVLQPRKHNFVVSSNVNSKSMSHFPKYKINRLLKRTPERF